MYRHCHICGRSLGRNTLLDAMPVGRRIAFDPERGRLWVVCARCGEWNLTPLEGRWELVETCERHFTGAPVRVSSAHVGTARVQGVELLRVGADAHRDELANWRYGPRLRRRRFRRGLVVSGAGVVGGAAIGGALLAGAAAGSLLVAGYAVAIAGWWVHGLVSGVGGVGAARFLGPHGQRVRLSGPLVEDVRLTRTSGAKGPRAVVAVAGPQGHETRYGRDAALRLLAAVLPRLNWRGADTTELARATSIVDAEEADASGRSRRARTQEPVWQRIAVRHWPRDGLLSAMDPVARLALEMAVTEEIERGALAGEAATLEGRWRDAEEVAGIADSLLLPTFVTDWLARHGKARRSQALTSSESAPNER